MIRYFVFATIIVGACAIVLGGWWAMLPRKQLTVASATTTMAPRAERAQKLASGAPAPFIATVPWALSVLPECVQQLMSARGSVPYVTARIPATAIEIRPPATLRYADCTVELSGSGALVRRGEDRLRIPPRVRLYRLRDELFVLREDTTGAELRVYAPR